jgi:hypothetical protein
MNGPACVASFLAQNLLGLQVELDEVFFAIGSAD